MFGSSGGSYEVLDASNVNAQPRRNWRRAVFYGGFAAVVVVIVVTLVVGLVVGLSARDDDDTTESAKDGNNNPPIVLPSTLMEAMTLDNLMDHLDVLQEIATMYNNSRAVRFGYNASVNYVVEILKASGYDPKVLPFSLPMATQLAAPQLSQLLPTPTPYKQNTDFIPFQESANANANFTVTLIPSLGCNDEDYTSINFAAGNAALVMRGNCSFVDKLAMAQKHNATAALVYNDGTDPSRMGPFGARSEESITIPAFALSFTLGESFICRMDGGTPLIVFMYSSSQFTVQYTSNVVVQTATGSTRDVIVIGSHLDSVEAGPGINDNGSGSSLNLELAIQFASLKINPVNQVRFAWWGAEELGLLGSKAYVNNQSTPEELADIALYLNFDMVGSPNHQVGVYNGHDTVQAPNGSAVIADLFAEAMTQLNVTSEWSDFNGRSDYGPFIAKGIDIPSGGLQAGAEGVKTMSERALWGGMANTAYDPCYHQLCDNTANINQTAFLDFARAAAIVLQKLAETPNLRAFINSTRTTPNTTLATRDEPSITYTFDAAIDDYALSYTDEKPKVMYDGPFALY